MFCSFDQFKSQIAFIPSKTASGGSPPPFASRFYKNSMAFSPFVKLLVYMSFNFYILSISLFSLSNNYSYLYSNCLSKHYFSETFLFKLSLSLTKSFKSSPKGCRRLINFFGLIISSLYSGMSK